MCCALPNDEQACDPQRILVWCRRARTPRSNTLIDDAATADRKPHPISTSAQARQAGTARGDACELFRRLAAAGQKIAVALDVAFAFAYETCCSVAAARRGNLRVISRPRRRSAGGLVCICVVLPGVYPELHAGTLCRGKATSDRHGRGDRPAAFSVYWRNAVATWCWARGLDRREGVRHEMLGALRWSPASRAEALWAIAG